MLKELFASIFLIFAESLKMEVVELKDSKAHGEFIVEAFKMSELIEIMVKSHECLSNYHDSFIESQNLCNSESQVFMAKLADAYTKHLEFDEHKRVAFVEMIKEYMSTFGWKE